MNVYQLRVRKAFETRLSLSAFLGPSVGLILTIFQWRVGSSTERKFEKNFHKRSTYSAIVTNLKKICINADQRVLAQNYYLFRSYNGG